jgi:hypothetical protein
MATQDNSESDNIHSLPALEDSLHEVLSYLDRSSSDSKSIVEEDEEIVFVRERKTHKRVYVFVDEVDSSKRIRIVRNNVDHIVLSDDE